MRESDIQRAILLHLGALPGVYVARTSAAVAYLPDGRGGHRLHRPLPAGWPDITACVGGRLVGIEVKTAAGRMSPGQERMRAAWEAAGALWIVARSVADVEAGWPSVTP